MKRLFKWFLRRGVTGRGFLDPFALLDRVRMFSRPSEVQEPIELLRAGAVFHARGLINTKAIQHNLDWVWPYWVEKQFDPASSSFLPRAFSATHVNLTHRNWTATGLPDCVFMPIVDPRGLVTPMTDGWSLECWVFLEKAPPLIPSRESNVTQTMAVEGEALKIVTGFERPGLRMNGLVFLRRDKKGVSYCECSWEIESESPAEAWVVLRPYNPEGVSFIDEIKTENDLRTIILNHKHHVQLAQRPDKLHLSNYDEGDVFHQYAKSDATRSVNEPLAVTRMAITCKAGMATAAAVYPIQVGQARRLDVTIPLDSDVATAALPSSKTPLRSWEQALASTPRLVCPDPQLCRLYEQSLITLTLLSPGEVYPGPYTYRRFWFRDAALMMQALLFAGHAEKCRSILDVFPDRQSLTGYFHSQEGEWDSNGQVLWIYELYARVTGEDLGDADRVAIRKGAEWILRKRITRAAGELHQGLLPPGFSAEHLGPVDYYWWDVFWSLHGLHAAANQLDAHESDKATTYRDAAVRWRKEIDAKLAEGQKRLGRPAIPAGPYRRLDAGAIGSIVCGYPLRLVSSNDARLLDTADYLTEACFHDECFFQDMIHSGMNPYLSLHIAQVFLRAGDERWRSIVKAVARLATSTGQWPEAIHPHTKGGCMGDGQHGWAAAEWFMMVRNLFIREEGQSLILCTGVSSSDFEPGAKWEFGPANTEFGSLHLWIDSDPDTNAFQLRIQSNWHRRPEAIRVAIHGLKPFTLDADSEGCLLQTDGGNA